jgi:AraC family transcriptional regulator, transcriptional activator of pobA
MYSFDKEYVFDSSHINGMDLEENFGKYSISSKVGFFCNFDLNQISNQPHFHNCYELYIITCGEGTFQYDKEAYYVKQGDIFIADPNVTHEISVNSLQNLQGINFFIEIKVNVHLKPRTLQDFSINSFLSGHKVTVGSQKHLLAYLIFIDAYFTAKRSRGFAIEQALKNLILECLDSLSVKSGSLHKVQANTRSTFELALDYIDHNLNNKIVISEVAKELCISERTLEYLFRKHMNKTIKDYVNEKKMTLAAHHLMKQFSVSDTAMQVGLSSTSQFIRLFKKYIGITPKKYQQLHISKVKEFGRRQQELHTELIPYE